MTPEDMPKNIMRMEKWLDTRLDGLNDAEQVVALKETIFLMEESAFKMATDVQEMTKMYNESIADISEKITKLAKHIGIDEYDRIMEEVKTPTEK